MTISSRPHNKARLSTMELSIPIVSALGSRRRFFFRTYWCNFSLLSFQLDDVSVYHWYLGSERASGFG